VQEGGDGTHSSGGETGRRGLKSAGRAHVQEGGDGTYSSGGETGRRGLSLQDVHMCMSCQCRCLI
jgi:hypothetical protein